MKVAYLVNRYPAVSHSFIRREIAAIEQSGISVSRFSIRPADGTLPDPDDRSEQERTTFILAQGWVALLCATMMLMVARPGRFLRAIKVAGRAIVTEPMRGWRQLAYLMEACWLSRHMGSIEHIHAHFGTNPTAVARLVFHLTGIPYSFTVHGPDEFDAPVALDLRGKIADARHAIAISSFGHSQLMRWSHPGDWSKIGVVRCGVDQMFLGENNIDTGPRSGLCCVARLSAQKGLPLLIQAASVLVRRGFDFKLTLVGDGEMRDDLEGMIVEQGLERHVAITGYLDAVGVRDVVRSSKAMVLPSFAEGLPVVIMEALALETPVIASAIAGTPELVDAECGWLVPAGAVDELVSAMAAALAAPVEQLDAMGKVGSQRVRASHDSRRNGAILARRFLESSAAWKTDRPEKDSLVAAR